MTRSALLLPVVEFLAVTFAALAFTAAAIATGVL